jgi:hypothetical protein
MSLRPFYERNFVDHCPALATTTAGRISPRASRYAG